MGVLYDVLFKPIGRGVDGGSPATTTTTAAAKTTAIADDVPAGAPNAAAAAAADQTPPEWVLDKRDGGSLVWRRYGPSPSRGRKRVEFLDAVQVRVFERDDHGAPRDHDGGGGGCVWADDWSWHADGDTESLFYEAWSDRDEYPVLVAVSVTVLGLCMGIAYLFAPVKWLLHQLLVDD